ncbi:Highly reducing polyketide synthase PKS6 [Cladobotryum mycophilum]|uniref:Highly reducing polyketide synthase PKS6 n=1 Tax=Cladobotryum mycophilum TaxID=491253 RepID=A0ABR0SBY0_9HYPO
MHVNPPTDSKHRVPNNASDSNSHLGVTLQTNAPEPIAIIGASCRLPGNASDLQKFWELLKAKRSAWSSFPDSRFNANGFYYPNGIGKQGTTYTAGGHFLEHDVAAFDSAFFGMYPNEIKIMDPQQRLLLEIAYEAFENAGFTLDDLSNSSTGVYVGQWTSDYHDIVTRDLDYTPTLLPVGTGPAISSNRISYFFNLKGPSFTLDTGCSSSLVALHQAILGLRTGDAEQSFVAGVNLTLDPHRYSYMSQVKLFSKEGKSFAFDSRASGYGRGEGCSGVLLQPLSLALKQGRPIRAIIRGSACNQDGRTAGITVPSSTAQMAAIKKAYADASLELYADYVEAHGTGTQVGDPLEAKAISATLGVTRSPDSPLPIGSLKGNIGHLESAAGVTSIIKALLMFENNEIPPQVNYEQPNPAIMLKKLNLRVPVEAERGSINRISINCFGYGGANAHVILDSAATLSLPHSEVRDLRNGNRVNGVELQEVQNGFSESAAINKVTRQRLFVLSAMSEKSCQSMAANLADYLDRKSTTANHQDDTLSQVAYTLSRRTTFSHRIGFVSSTFTDLVEQLRASTSQPVPVYEGKASPRIAFVFSGQGAQYPLMAQELLGKWPVFTASLERAGIQVIQCGGTWNLIEELLRPNETSQISTPELAQPITTAIQLALVDALRDLGVNPTTVAGHSSGEIAAAYCAGMLSFEDAIQVSFYRGKFASVLATKPDGQGTMLAVGASPAVVQEAIQQLENFQSRMQIACYNSPSSVTVSGDTDAVEMLHVLMDERKIFNRMLRTNNVAYHSHQMKLIAEEYGASIANIKPTTSNSSVSMISSLTGEAIGDTIVDKDYWVKNMVSPVCFTDAITKIYETKSRLKKINMFLEIGPHFQLVGPVKQTLRSLGSDANKIQCVGCLKRGENADVCLVNAIRSLWLEKYPVNLERVNSGFGKCPELLIDMPPYSFDHSKTFWHESRVSQSYRNRQDLPHELLGSMSFEHNPMEPRWRLCLSLDNIPWLKGHRVQGEIVFPAAAFFAMAIQAIEQDTQHKSPGAIVERFQLSNVCIENALVLNSVKDDIELYLTLRPQTYSARRSSSLWKEFRIFSVSRNDVWSEHCRGLIHTALADDTKPCMPKNPVKINQVGQTINPKKLYFLSKDIGLDWTAPFDSLTDLKTCGGAAITTVTQSAVGDIGYGPNGLLYAIHPAVLDSCLFQGMAAILLLEDNVGTAFVPTFIKSLSIAAPKNGKLVQDLTCFTKRAGGHLSFDFSAFEKGSENMIIQAQGLKVTQLPSTLTGANGNRELCHAINWVAYLPAVSEKWLQDVCRSSVEPQSIARQCRTLEALALSYIKPALELVSFEEIPDNHLRYWHASIKAHSANEYNPEDLCVDLTDKSILGQMLQRIGPKIADILLGSVQPLTLLAEDDILDRFYRNEAWSRCYDQIGKFCSELGRQKPGLKILEVGAGTAAVSQLVLASLRMSGKMLASQYQFTDISSAHFQTAQDRLVDFKDVVHYQALNIEQDPVSQGFASHEYDLVIAVNAIHSTSSLSQSLDNIKSLLKPGGTLILMETTKDTISLNLCFGALPKWWAGYGEGRTLSPLVTEEDWSSHLQAHGFSNTDTCFRDYEPEDGGSQCVFVATAEHQASTVAAPALHVVTSSIQDPLASHFAQQLRQRMPINEIVLRGLSSPVADAKISIILPDITNGPAGIDIQQFDNLKRLITSSEVILFVSCNETNPGQMPNHGWVPGFCRSLRLEHPDIRIVTLQVEGQLDTGKIDTVATILQSPSMDPAVPGAEVDSEFLQRDGQLYVPRAVHQQEMSDYIHQSHGNLGTIQDQFFGSRALVVGLGAPNQIETLRWTDDLEVDGPLHPDYIKIRLCAASINFKDVLIAAGQLEGITDMVNDCSGVVIEVGDNMKHRYSLGDRVCAANAKSFTNYPIVHGEHCIHIPDDMDFETAASVSIAWTTALYGLVDCGRLQKGEKVLIHSAAGAVGQAAIMIAKHLGAEVFATCGNDLKKELLVRDFGIPKNQVFSSRSADFRDEMMSLTSGQGIDVVLNSLSEEMLRASCNVLAPFGRFVEIGRKDMMEDALLPMEFMLNNITFSYVDLHQLSIMRPKVIQRLLRTCMDLFINGSVQPMELTKVPISEISDAFRFLLAGKHTGKVILTVEPDQQVKTLRPRPKLPTLKEDATYIITGGLGGLGKRIVSWLSERGARNIVIMSRSGALDDAAHRLIDKLESNRVKVAIKRCDIASEDALRRTISDIQSEMPPIRGLIQSAMVTRDSLFVDMTATQWAEAMNPKALGTWNLHTILQVEMDFFITLSSGVAVSGNVGQCNYAAGCSFQDALAHYRTQLGLAAHSINVGAIADVGFVSENPEVATTLRRQGLGTITISDFLSHLDHVVRKEDYQRETGQQLPCQSVVGLIPSGDELNLGPSTWMNDMKFAFLNPATNSTQDLNNTTDVGTALSSAKTVEEATAIISRAILSQLGKMIGLPSDSMSASRSLSSYGIDSLITMDLRNWISVVLKANISLLVIKGIGLISELVKLIVQDSKWVNLKV